MDFAERLEELKKQRDNVIGQIAPALQQLGFLEGQITLLGELIKEDEDKKTKKEAQP